MRTNPAHASTLAGNQNLLAPSGDSGQDPSASPLNPDMRNSEKNRSHLPQLGLFRSLLYFFWTIIPTWLNLRRSIPQATQPHCSVTPEAHVSTEKRESPNARYERHLLVEGHGFPLWAPQPHSRLPLSYRRKGVSIGDVGIITRQGYFDYLFNICLPHDDASNRGFLPTNFAPVDLLPTDISEWREHDPGSCLLTSSTEKLSGLTFKCNGPEGSILAMPDGAYHEDLLNLLKFKRTALQNAEDWYKFAIGTCGREIENGELRLVTGCDKTNIWGIATYSDFPSGTLTLTANGVQSPVEYTWNYEGRVEAKAGPRLDGLLDAAGSQEGPWDIRNQCTFLRSYTFTLADDVWKNMVSTLVEDPSIVSGSSLGFGNRGRSVNVRNHSLGSEKLTIHPAMIINQMLLNEYPNARVAISHDSDWCTVVREDETTMPDTSELLGRIRQTFMFHFDEDGAVYLSQGHAPETNPQRQQGDYGPTETLLFVTGQTGCGESTPANSATDKTAIKVDDSMGSWPPSIRSVASNSTSTDSGVSLTRRSGTGTRQRIDGEGVGTPSSQGTKLVTAAAAAVVGVLQSSSGSTKLSKPARLPSDLPVIETLCKPPLSAFSRGPALTPVANVRDSVLTQKLGTSSSLCPPATSTASGLESPRSARSMAEQIDQLDLSPLDPEINKMLDYDDNNASYRPRLAKNNGFLPPAPSKPPSNSAPSTLNPQKSKSGVTPAFMDLFGAGKSKSKSTNPTATAGHDTTPMSRTASDSITALSALLSRPPSIGMGTRGLEVAGQEKMNDISVTAKPNRGARLDQGAQKAMQEVFEDAIDPTAAVDHPPPSSNYPFAVQASGLHGLGVQGSLGVGLSPPTSHSMASSYTDNGWRKASLREAVHQLPMAIPDSSTSSRILGAAPPSASQHLGSATSLREASPRLQRLESTQILDRRILDQSMINSVEVPHPTHESPQGKVSAPKGDSNRMPEQPSHITRDALRSSYFPIRTEIPFGPMTPPTPSPQRHRSKPRYSPPQTEIIPLAPSVVRSPSQVSQPTTRNPDYCDPSATPPLVPNNGFTDNDIPAIKQLNDICQYHGLRVVYDEKRSGQKYARIWTITVYIGGIQCGVGMGMTRIHAKEAAAISALNEWSGKTKLSTT